MDDAGLTEDMGTNSVLGHMEKVPCSKCGEPVPDWCRSGVGEPLHLSDSWCAAFLVRHFRPDLAPRWP